MGFSTEIKYTVKPGKKPPKTLDNKLRAWQGKTTAALSQQPGPVKRPVRWTSERQRRAFFASNGFGRGIPTQRSGKVAQWITFVDYDGLEKQRLFLYQLKLYLATLNPLKLGKRPAQMKDFTLISIENDAPYMRYVTGFNQQGFHKDTGWIYTPSIILDAVEEVDGMIRDTGIL